MRGSGRESGGGSSSSTARGKRGRRPRAKLSGRAKQARKKAARQPAEGGDSSEHEVERIVNDVKINNINWYLIKWKGFSDEFNTWTAENDLSCPDILRTYMRRRRPDKVDLAQFYMLLKDAKGLPITVINEVDDATHPANFTYIDRSIYSDEIPRPCSPMFSCRCTDGCRSSCPCSKAQCYDDSGCVQVPSDVALMECGPKCKCGDKCVTRVVQKGPNLMFEIIRTELKGWGVRTKSLIPVGTFIAEYVGEIITCEDADKRGAEDTLAGLTYLFDIDKEYSTNQIADFSIDAKTHGNISHFFNHSCEPNMEIRHVFIEHRDPRLHHIAFFASRDIKVGEELTFDYNPDAGSDTGKFRCHCGSKNCRNFIFS
ncbi:hypothetical protein GGI12_000030 [Dipsacomyces acuminosporus]|nr:hypothetical protein GGI12_000030 [Dipsacomyces acuminosporus]